MANSIQNNKESGEAIVRNTVSEDISKIVDLQKESFPYLARYGNIWRPEELESHIRIFPQGQFVAVEPDGTVVGSASSLIVTLNPEYAEHTWTEITGNGMFTNITLMEIVFMELISRHIQNSDMKE
jgi:hypothetical protein